MAALPEYWIPLLSAAAASGDAGRVIRDFIKESRETTEFRWQRRRALAYPIIVAVIALAVAVALSLTVLPVYRELFQSFGLQQPHLTAWIFDAGRWLASGWGAATIGGAALLAALAALGVLPGVRWLRSTRWGSWFGRSTAIAQFTQFTSDLLSAGVGRGDAVRIAAHTTRHPAMQRAGWALASAIERDVDGPLAVPRPVPATAVYALHGDLPNAARQRLLTEISGCYADRASRRLSWTRGLIGPAAILVIGICVGVVVVALFLPMMSLVTNLVG
jgi:type IV pilus assembly protein PilC